MWEVIPTRTRDQLSLSNAQLNNAAGFLIKDLYRTLFSFDRYKFLFLISWDSTSLEVLIPGPLLAIPRGDDQWTRDQWKH